MLRSVSAARVFGARFSSHLTIPSGVPYKKLVDFKGKLFLIGCGSIGQGVLPLLLRHIDMKPDQIKIITADDRGKECAGEFNVEFAVNGLTKKNYKTALAELKEGDFILNLSVDVSSTAVMRLCHEKGAMYLDTVAEPWSGYYTDTRLSVSQRSNYALREQVLDLRKELGVKGPTAVSCHGANPGMVSHFVKQALLNVAQDVNGPRGIPKNKAEWAALAQTLGVRVIHIAERDTQVSNNPKQVGEFVNTWSVDGFCSEGSQPAELGWGSHEKHLPKDGKRHDFGSDCAIYLQRPGASTRVRTWTPNEGPMHGFLITHNEAITIPDYYTVKKDGKVAYRPTVHYSYHPCDDAVMSIHEFAGKNWHQQERQRIIVEEAIRGMDELGVLLAGHKKNAYWYGSQLTLEEARRLCPFNNATSLQVAVSCLAGVVWAMRHPKQGIVEPDEVDYKEANDIIIPYVTPMVGAYTNWNPLQDRGRLFPEDIDKSDPWQFQNIRVN